jgi:hypothetical protein
MDYPPGSEAPEAGAYEKINIFGTPTGNTECMAKGGKLPWRRSATAGARWGRVTTARPPHWPPLIREVEA